jgi:hypothetical protein
LAAAASYREIGRTLLARDCDPLAPRAVVPAHAKLRAVCLWRAAPPPAPRPKAEDVPT